jgi:hypothetical protein
LRIVALGFIAPSAHPETITDLYANEDSISEMHFSTSASSEYALTIPVSVIRPDGELRLTFRNRTPISPKSLGISDDRRVLGSGMISIELTPASEQKAG